MRTRSSLLWVFLAVAVGCGGPVAPPGSPAAPSELKVTEQAGGAHLTWKDNSTNEDDFEVWRREGSGEFAKLFTVLFDITQFHDATVAPGVTYTYRVRAENINGASLFSSDAMFTLTSSGSGGGSAGAGGSGGAGGGGPVQFQRDVAAIIGRSCGSGNMSCHSAIVYFANSDQGCRGWLALEDKPLGAMYCGPNGCRQTGCPDRTLYQRLLQLEPWMCMGGKRYVVPGDPNASLLFKILSSADPSMSGACRDGNNVPLARMPLDPMTMMPAPALPAAEIETIRQWILAGAPNN